MEKPRIHAKTNDIIATAEQTLKSFEAEYEIVLKTDIRTSIGNIYIVKVTRSGNALIAGPSGITGMARTIQILKEYSPDKILIDGAFFRHSLAKISDATVFVVGANFSPNMYKTIEDAKLTIEKFQLEKPVINVDFFKDLDNVCMISDNHEIHRFDFGTAIGNTEIIFKSQFQKYKFLYLPKSLTNDFVERLVEHRHRFDLDIIVDSPVSVQLNFDNLQRLFKLENRVYVMNPINLVAVCYNPYSPRGYEYDDNDFKYGLEQTLNRKIYNVEKE